MSLFKKYKTPLIILLILYIITIILPLFLLPGYTLGSILAEPIRYIPNTLSDGQIIVVIITIDTLAPVVGALVSGYLLGPVYLCIHRFVIGRNKVYEIQERSRTQDEKFKGIFRGFFPAMLAANLLLILQDFPMILALLVDVEAAVDISIALNGFMPVVLGLSIALFAPAWSLLDTGILSSNKEKVKETGELLEIQSMGGWYLGFLKGYAGLTTILTLFLYLGAMGVEITLIGTFVGIPLYTLISLAAIVLFDITSGHRRKFLLNFASRIGIPTQELEHE